MSNWNDEKIKVKDIFDAIRNYALSGLVLYTGVYTFIQTSNIVFLYYSSKVFGAAFILLSIYLFYINTALFNKIVKKEYKAGNVGKIYFFITSLIVVLVGFNVFTHTAGLIKL